MQVCISLVSLCRLSAPILYMFFFQFILFEGFYTFSVIFFISFCNSLACLLAFKFRFSFDFVLSHLYLRKPHTHTHRESCLIFLFLCFVLSLLGLSVSLSHSILCRPACAHRTHFQSFSF